MRTRFVLLGIVMILSLGAGQVAGFAILYWEINEITDGPWRIGLLVFGFCYLCALPGLVAPYCYFAKKMGNASSLGVLPSAMVGIAYPWNLVIVTYLGGLAVGHNQMAWDRLVESLFGWLLLLLMTLGSGIVLSYVSIRLDAVLQGRRGQG